MYGTNNCKCNAFYGITPLYLVYVVSGMG